MTNYVYILDGNLARIGVVEGWSSIIWAKRYVENGDCELYVAATSELLGILVPGNYIERPDDDMICRIDKTELKTSAESGDYISAHGVDVRSFLDQRIVWSTTQAVSNAQSFIRTLVNDSLIDPVIAARKLLKTNGGDLMALDTADASLNRTTTEQTSYKNVGAKVREIVSRYGWGTKIRLDSGLLKFGVYAGTDRSASVVFADDFENLISTDYIVDRTTSIMMNVALVGGSGEGAARHMASAGVASGVDRYETFVDAKNTSNVLKYSELKAMYPLVADGGNASIVNVGGDNYYQCASFDIQIFDSVQQAEAAALYPGGVYMCVTTGDYCLYRITNANIALLPSGAPADDDTVYLQYPAYNPRLVSLGYDQITGKDEKRTFEGSIDPMIIYEYKTDYDLGDIVTIRNQYGLSAAVRITEVIEVDDENGYRVEPKFQYQS